MHLNQIEPGVFEVMRNPGEQPFAQLKAPRHQLGSSWGIYFPNNPRDGGYTFTFASATKAAAIRQLQKTIRVCSTYQLGLGPYVKGE